jgi:hypothetical protein
MSTTMLIPETGFLRLRRRPPMMERRPNTLHPALRRVLLHHHRGAKAEPCRALLRDVSDRCVRVLADCPFRRDTQLIVEFPSERVRSRVVRVALATQTEQDWMIMCELDCPLSDAELQALRQSDWHSSSCRNEGGDGQGVWMTSRATLSGRHSSQGQNRNQRSICLLA